jgi:uncharacterized protein YvpB
MKTKTVALLVIFCFLQIPSSEGRVFKADNGDVRITGIPMVLQTGRSSCAPATMVRVLRYYGIDVDQEELANRVGSTEDNGTDVGKMLDEVAKICSNYNLGVKTIIGLDYSRFAKIIAKYNIMARKLKHPELSISEDHIDLSETFKTSDIKILRSTASKRELVKFAKTVEGHIENNSPLIWGIVLGIAPEPDIAPYTSGGHLRLIIGYNEKTAEIIYSDPWGPKHERKKIPLADAYAITMSLHTLIRTTNR